MLLLRSLTPLTLPARWPVAFPEVANMNGSRRQMLLLLVFGTIYFVHTPIFAQQKRTPIIDAHTHCFAGKANKLFPYHPLAPYQPDEPATVSSALKA